MRLLSHEAGSRMMRTLSLLRHAKSSWDDPTLADFDRPLNARGRRAAPVMGRHMRAIGLAPDHVLCSPAVRTRETARLALESLGLPELAVTYDDSIYEASHEALLARLGRVPATASHVLLIGHNPGLHELTLDLLDGRIPAAQKRLGEKLPTGALVVLALDIAAWSAIRRGCGRLQHHATPRELDG
jgi:phosphohistidine phosphatase